MADHGSSKHTVSDMSKFESPDPGCHGCRHGYAIANVDPRGIGHSEGDFVQFGTQDGKDGYDFIEWAAQQDWCNGRCGLAGNSCVAMTQWRIAAQQPPHLHMYRTVGVYNRYVQRVSVRRRNPGKDIRCICYA